MSYIVSSAIPSVPAISLTSSFGDVTYAETNKYPSPVVIDASDAINYSTGIFLQGNRNSIINVQTNKGNSININAIEATGIALYSGGSILVNANGNIAVAASNEGDFRSASAAGIVTIGGNYGRAQINNRGNIDGSISVDRTKQNNNGGELYGIISGSASSDINNHGSITLTSNANNAQSPIATLRTAGIFQRETNAQESNDFNVANFGSISVASSANKQSGSSLISDSYGILSYSNTVLGSTVTNSGSISVSSSAQDTSDASIHNSTSGIHFEYSNGGNAIVTSGSIMVSSDSSSATSNQLENFAYGIYMRGNGEPSPGSIDISGSGSIASNAKADKVRSSSITNSAFGMYLESIISDININYTGNVSSEATQVGSSGVSTSTGMYAIAYAGNINIQNHGNVSATGSTAAKGIEAISNSGEIFVDNYGIIKSAGICAICFQTNSRSILTSRIGSTISGNIESYRSLTLRQYDNDYTYFNAFTGDGSLIIEAPYHSLTFLGANSYSGGTTVMAGTLIGNTSSLQGNIVNNAAVSFNQKTDGIYAGAMSGKGSLTKFGEGSLTLTGANSFTGPTIVNEGILAINGFISSAVQVMSGAQLQGLGYFGGGIINNGGIISPGNGIGTIYSNGNITFNSGSFYRVDVNAAGQSDRIQVNGNVIINGGAVQVNAVSGNYRPTQKYAIIQANGNLLGRFDAVSTNSILLRPSLSYDERDAFLTLDRVTDSNGEIPFWQIAKTINQHNVARSLTVGARGPVSSQGLNVIDSILTGTGQSGQAVLDAVGGAGLAGVQTTAMEVGQMVSSTISDQIAYWRSGEINDVTGITLHDSQIHDRSRSFMAYAPIENGVVVKNPIKLNGPAASLLSSVPPVRTYRAWGSMFGGGANFLSDAGRGTPSATVGYYGGLLGVDYQLTPQALVGVSLGGSSSGFSVGSLSTTGNLTGFHAGLYGSYTMGASYIALNETFSNYSNKTNRSAGGYSFLAYENLSANFGSTEFRTRLEGGHSLVLGGLKATPFIAAEIAAYNVNGFSEKSSLLYQSSLALKNNGQTINSLPTFVGLRLSNAYTLANGWRLAPIGSVAYVHEFFPQRQFTNILMSIPSQDFNVAGPRSTYNLVQTKLGVMMNINKKFAVFSDFQGEFSPMSQSYGGTAGFRYNW